MTLSKPRLVRFHDFSGMNSMSYVVSEACRYFAAVTNISVISIGQITAQKSQSETMAVELVASSSQLRLMAIDAQRAEQLRTGIAG